MGLELTFNLFGREFLIPDTIVNVWVVVLFLLLFGLFVKRKIEAADPKEAPSGFINVVEVTVESVNNLVSQNMGEKHLRFAPYIYSLMAFLLVANLSGMVGLTPPTSDYSVTFTLALITFFLSQFSGIRTHGIIGHIKGLFEPMAFLFPLNLLGDLADPISLSFRLFGNIISGVIIMTLIYSGLMGIIGILTPIVTPLLHGYFDLFSGVLQTFIFGMLTMIFIGDNLED